MLTPFCIDSIIVLMKTTQNATTNQETTMSRIQKQKRDDARYLAIAHDLPSYNWEATPGGIKIGYPDPDTNEVNWLAGEFTTSKYAMIALGRFFAPKR